MNEMYFYFYINNEDIPFDRWSEPPPSPVVTSARSAEYTTPSLRWAACVLPRTNKIGSRSEPPFLRICASPFFCHYASASDFKIQVSLDMLQIHCSWKSNETPKTFHARRKRALACDFSSDERNVMQDLSDSLGRSKIRRNLRRAMAINIVWLQWFEASDESGQCHNFCHVIFHVFHI
jgi:hypothetical protein